MFEAGQTFAGYLIDSPLGNRLAIENYQARKEAGGSLVRLTVLTEELLPDEVSRKNFITAAEPVCRIKHPGIARLLEVGQADGRAFYVSEFSPGGNFKQILGVRLRPGQALRFTRDLAGILEHLHAADVVHGNLKPGNILVGPDEQLILTDVGMACFLKLDYTLGIDPYYVSPEQVRGAQPGASSDIYSLGIVLYQMLCGILPFQADNDFRIAMLRLDEPLPALPSEYQFLQPLLDRMLQTDSQQRPSAGALLGMIDSLVVEADAAEFNPQKLSVQQQGEVSMADQSAEDNVNEMTVRIEKTLAEREQQRRDEPSLSEDSLDSPSEVVGRSSSSFSYLMLLLGLVVGAVIGVALYFVVPRPEMAAAQPEIRVASVAGLDKADRLLLAGEYAKAKKAYLALIARNPGSPRPYNNLASLYAAEGDLEQAQALLKNALETAPDYLAIYRNIGTVYAAMARDSYGKALLLEGEKKPVKLQVLGTVGQQLKPEADKTVSEEVTRARTAQKTPVKVSAAPEAGETAVKVPVETADKTKTPIRAESASADPKQPVSAAVEAAPQGEPESEPRAAAKVSLAPQQFLQQWAAAWSAQDIDAYLARYAPEYTPPNNLSRQVWENQRRQRLSAPTFIEVSLEPIEAISGTGDTAKVQVVQHYRSDRYRDKTRKSFVLRRDGDSWLIVEEKSLGRVR